MLTQGDDVEVHALHQRGWSISAIARHLERDRKTVRAYVRGERTAGVRRSRVPDPLEPFAPYLAARLRIPAKAISQSGVFDHPHEGGNDKAGSGDRRNT